MIFFGRPSRLPRLRARAKPACTRSLRRILSCVAIVARMEMTASLKIPRELKLRLDETAITDADAQSIGGDE
jgi:hypothetical protein